MVSLGEAVVEQSDDPPQLYKVVDGILHLYFHPGQVQAWESTRRFVFVIAGSQGGKTSFGGFHLAREIENRGKGDYLAVTSNFDLFKLKFLPSILEVFEGVLKIGRLWSGERLIEIRDPETEQFWARRADDPMFARVILRSAVAKGGLEAATAKGAWLDECGQSEFTLGTWEAVRRRLSLSRGRVLGTTTPYDLGWLKREIVDRWKRGDPDYDVIRFASIMNPAFPMEEYLDVKGKMPKWKFKMMYRGFFTRPAGMIYEDFVDKWRDRGGHRVKDFDIPSDWTIHIGVDPGSENITKVWMAHDPYNDIYFVFREEHGGKRSTDEHVADLFDEAFENGQAIEDFHVGSKSESQQRLDWKASCDSWLDQEENFDKVPDGYISIVPDPIVTDVEAGIDRVISLLRTFRIFFFESVSGVLEDVRNYSRELDELDRPTIKIKDKETFHFVDALRYVVVGVTDRLEEIPFQQGSERRRERVNYDG